MDAIELFRRVEELLDDEMKTRTEGIASGRLEDFAAYKYATGELAGLRKAIQLIRDATAEYEVS